MGETWHVGELLRAMARADPSDVVDVVRSAAGAFDGWDTVLYLADFEQQTLEPLGDHAAHAELSHPEEIGTTIAGRAFLQRQPTTAERPDGVRVWVPIVEGSDVTGVLGLTVPSADHDVLEGCADLGILAGYLLATQARVTDLYGLHRRRKAMTLPASLQWDLLPPLTMTSPRVVVAGMLEPAYEVGGDCFDYALNGNQLDFAFMDSMGHGLRSALVAALALGCYRHDRREGRPLDFAHRSLDAAIAGEHGGEAFVTGHIGRLDLTSGEMRWINAGHPSPLLVRSGRVIGPLNGPPTRPWGVGPSGFEVNATSLQPGDSVLFYTDGVVEARSARGRDFGIDRLSDLVGRFASDEIATPLIVRHVVRAVLDHHGGTLSDDATVLMVQWPGHRP
jgi:hypothetical protein